MNKDLGLKHMQSIWGVNLYAGYEHRPVLLDKLIEQLVKEIVFCMSSETKFDVYGDANPLASVELLGFICQRYQVSPTRDETVIRKWREKYLQVFDKRTDIWMGRREVVVATFDKLEDAARKYFGK